MTSVDDIRRYCSAKFTSDDEKRVDVESIVRSTSFWFGDEQVESVVLLVVLVFDRESIDDVSFDLISIGIRS